MRSAREDQKILVSKVVAYFDAHWPEIAAGHETKWNIAKIDCIHITDSNER